MALTEDDVREILRLIDEADVEELRVRTEGFSLHVVRGKGAGGPAESGAGEASRDTGAPLEGDGAADGLLTITAPIVGTFYRAPAPGAPPFVTEGTTVEPDTVVGLIEVMKMMNPIPAGVAGTIVEVCAANAEPVEFGTPLFRVRPRP